MKYGPATSSDGDEPIDASSPEDERAEPSEEEQEELAARMAAFAAYVTQCRDEAVSARLSSGIEQVWLQCEEDYLGIDDLNRHEWVGARWAAMSKGAAIDAPLRDRSFSGRDEGRDPNRATVFPRIAARYVDAGSAKAAEITIPIDGSTFAMEPTPVPELAKGVEDQGQVAVDGRPQMRAGDPEQGEPAQMPLTVADLAKKQQAMADEAAQQAEDQINDWLVECKHSLTLRKAIFDGARLGTMIIKGPCAASRRTKVVKTGQGGVQISEVEKTVPITAHVSPWNFYPADDCGEDAISGSYCLERDTISKRTLARLKGQPGYMNWAIDKVLTEGPKRGAEVSTHSPLLESEKRKMFDIWYFYGSIPFEALALTNPDMAEAMASTMPEGAKEVDAIVTLVNDTPIKAVPNPLQSGNFGYRVAPWRRRAGHWAGVGVTEQCRPATLIVTGAWRATINNAGKSAGSIIVMDDEVLIPADGSRRITPDKLYRKAPEATMDDVRKAFATYQIPNITQQLMPIIEAGMRLAEESTSIPLISQGMSGDNTPDTFGGAQLQNSNANQLLRDIGFGIAEQLTEPLVKDLYDWLLLDPDVPDSAKGDMQVNVSGSIALVEKALQDMTIAQLAPLVTNPAFGFDPKKWSDEYLRSKRLTPSMFKLTEEQQAELDKQPPPEAPQVTVAKIRSEAQVSTAQSRDQLIAEKTRVDTDRDTAYNELMRTREEASFATEREKMTLQRDIADLKYRQSLLDYANRRAISEDQAKVELTKTAATLSLQEKLATGANGKAEEVAEPVVEPVGRAPDGRAFQA